MSTPGREGHVQGELGAYILGGLRPAEAADVRAHLDACDQCRTEHEYLAAVSGWLGELSAADALSALEPPED